MLASQDTRFGRQKAESEDLLDSWKEIAVFLHRGVRTVQRWEREEGLPVHRHHHGKRGTVFASTSEIKQWTRRQDATASNFGDSATLTPNVPSTRLLLESDRWAQRCTAARAQAIRVRKFCKMVSDIQRRDSAEIKRLVAAASRLSG